MTHSIFIDGAEGTAGIEIRERLAGRSEFEIIALSEDKRKDASARRDALNACDFAVLCLPDEAAREAVSWINNSATRVIDASSAHRVADGWTYGFPELIGREAVANADRVTNPGCYPTGFLSLVAPLVKAGLLPADWPYTVNAVSGYSGGGKALIARFQGEEKPAFRTYGFGMKHKHLPEMQNYAGLEHAPIFSPSVVSAFRGMVVEVPLNLAAIRGAGTPNQFRAALTEFYAGSRIVRVSDEPRDELLLHKAEEPHDGMELFVFASADGSVARLIAILDNLGKGASGAAVQSLNLMAGLPESTGLRLPA